MIDETLQEQAALHVLVALTTDEAKEFKAKMQADAELKQFVARLHTVTGVIAGSVQLTTPPPQLRDKILGLTDKLSGGTPR